MPVQNVGDMSQHFQSLRQVGQVKTSLNRLSNELATQQKSDVTAALGGSTAQLETLEREINRLTGYSDIVKEVGQRLSFMQATLGGVEDIRSARMSQFLGISKESSDFAIQNAAVAAESAFSQITGAFNQRWGDFALFSGATTDQSPLAEPELMLNNIKAAIVGLNTADEIIAAVDTWFDDPLGGFATMGYLGDTSQLLVQKIGANKDITINARADGAAAVSLLKSAALASLANESVPGLSKDVRASLVSTSGQMLLNAGDVLTDMRAAVGVNESALRETEVTISTQLTAFQINRNGLTVADPFETATRLQDVQQQLELQYTVTARLSQLSLVNFL